RNILEMISKTAPEYLRNYMKYFVDTGEKGELSEKTKELISIAIAVTSRCLPCTAFHVLSAVEYGATKKEILEASEVAVLMGGSPSFVYLKHVIDACEEFGAG
ncbi:MAG: carboxymuconolactone decarboxylase family protein, partial [Actinobacteria bacterium]|nr:carboxymuconolactone decarboxylase family protein [Actinomycetota bacterium]